MRELQTKELLQVVGGTAAPSLDSQPGNRGGHNHHNIQPQLSEMQEPPGPLPSKTASG